MGFCCAAAGAAMRNCMPGEPLLPLPVLLVRPGAHRPSRQMFLAPFPACLDFGRPRQIGPAVPCSPMVSEHTMYEMYDMRTCLPHRTERRSLQRPRSAATHLCTRAELPQPLLLAQTWRFRTGIRDRKPPPRIGRRFRFAIICLQRRRRAERRTTGPDQCRVLGTATRRP